MSRISLHKFNEASSGTGPTSVADSDASPVNLTPTYGGAAAWTSVSGYGNALRLPNAGTVTRCTAALGGTKFATSFGGSAKAGTLACAVQINTGFGSSNYGSLGVGWQNTGTDGIILQAGDKAAPAGIELGLSTTINGTGGDVVILPSLPANGWHVFHSVIDTPNATANLRAWIAVDGFRAADASTGSFGAIPQNGILPAATDIESGALTVDPATYQLWGVDQGAGAVYDHAFSLREVLVQALRWFAAGASDLDPDTAGASLVSATGQAGVSGGLGATTDASTSNTDHTAAPTVTISASGNNRGVFLAITGAGVSAGVSGTPTLNGTNGTKITNTLSGTNDVEWWWWNDAALPGSAGTYTFSATVDGTNGTLACSAHYLEGVSQSAPTNFGSATGTGTSITSSMTSNPAAGSILLGALLDITTGDTPTHGVNQLPLAQVNGTSTGNTHVHVGSAKYVTSSGADSMSWTGLTNSSAKIGLAIEVAAFSSGGGATLPPQIYGIGMNGWMRTQAVTPQVRSSARSALIPATPAVSPPVQYGYRPLVSIAQSYYTAPYYVGSQVIPGMQLTGASAAPSAAPADSFAAVGAALAAGAPSAAPTINALFTAISLVAGAPSASPADSFSAASKWLFAGAPSVAPTLNAAASAGALSAGAPSAAPAINVAAGSAALIAAAPSTSPADSIAGTGRAAKPTAPSAAPTLDASSTSAALKAAAPSAAPADSFAATSSSASTGQGAPSAAPTLNAAATGAAKTAGAPSAAPVDSFNATALALKQSAPSAAPTVNAAATGNANVAGAPSAAPADSMAGTSAAKKASAPNVSPVDSIAGTGQSRAGGSPSAAPTDSFTGTGKSLNPTAPSAAPTLSANVTSLAQNQGNPSSAPTITADGTSKALKASAGAVSPADSVAGTSATAASNLSSAPTLSADAAATALRAGAPSAAPADSFAAGAQKAVSGAPSAAPTLNANATGGSPGTGQPSADGSVQAAATGKSLAAAAPSAAPTSNVAATILALVPVAPSAAPTISVGAAGSAAGVSSGSSAPTVDAAGTGKAVATAVPSAAPLIDAHALAGGTVSASPSSAPTLSASASAKTNAQGAPSASPTIDATLVGVGAGIGAPSCAPSITVGLGGLSAAVARCQSAPTLNAVATSKDIPTTALVHVNVVPVQMYSSKYLFVSINKTVPSPTHPGISIDVRKPKK